LNCSREGGIKRRKRNRRGTDSGSAKHAQGP
jgi:hypothetical protein